MPKSRNNPDRKQKLNKFKNKRKQMSQEQKTGGMPPVRNVPIWNADTEIIIKGFEWEAIQNGLVNLQLAQQAAQSVMSRNIVNGVIKMDFEKINPLTMQYEPMTEDEKVPFRADFEKMLDGFRQQAEAAKQAQATQPSGLVTESGEPLAAPVEEKPKKKTAKVIKMEPAPVEGK